MNKKKFIVIAMAKRNKIIIVIIIRVVCISGGKKHEKYDKINRYIMREPISRNTNNIIHDERHALVFEPM